MKKSGRLRDFIIRTVWPYLGLSEGALPTPAGSLAATPFRSSPPAAPLRMTQQLLFSTPAVGIDYVGRLDVPPNLLVDAALLWRAAGGEVIRSFELNKLTDDGNTWVVELTYSQGGARVALHQFDPPILVTLSGSSFEAKVFPNQAMPSNSGLYAVVRVGPDYNPDIALRIDGVVEMERNANLF